MELEAALNSWLCMRQNYTTLARNAGAHANSAKYLGGEAGLGACTQAIMTAGGMGYAKEYHVERLLREVMISRIAPVSPQMILNYISERVLELPRFIRVNCGQRASPRRKCGALFGPSHTEPAEYILFEANIG